MGKERAPGRRFPALQDPVLKKKEKKNMSERERERESGGEKHAYITSESSLV